MKMPILAGIILLMMLAPAAAAAKKGMRFWNLTGETLTEVALAPAGTTGFGPNQCKNDKDGTVDFDEDLAIKGVSPGRYDLRLKDDKGRVCYARAVEVKADETFSVKDTELTDCTK
jgi:hypothetical protein